MQTTHLFVLLAWLLSAHESFGSFNKGPFDKVLDGYCRSGKSKGTFDKTTRSTIQACRNLCLTQAYHCTGIEYNFLTRRCEVHYGYITHAADSGNKPVKCEIHCGPGVTDCKPTHDCYGKVGDGKCNVGKLKSTSARTPDGCQRDCKNEPECRGYQFYRYKKKCTLFDSRPTASDLKKKEGYVCFYLKNCCKTNSPFEECCAWDHCN